MQPESKFADLGDVTLHYREAGTGEPLVLIHGWPQTSYMWRGVIPHLADRFRVIAVDMRGLGESSIPESGYDTTTVSGDIWRLMTQVIGAESFFVGAHDWGGPVAYALAATHRRNIRAMAILDVPALGDGTSLNSIARWHYGFNSQRGFAEAMVAGREDVFLNHFFDTGSARPDSISADARAEYIARYSQPGRMTAGFEYYRAMRRDVKDHERYRAEGPLEMPILVFGGDTGRGNAALDSWKKMANNVSGGIAENCGHWIAEESPEWTARQFGEFFTNVSNTGANTKNG